MLAKDEGHTVIMVRGHSHMVERFLMDSLLTSCIRRTLCVCVCVSVLCVLYNIDVYVSVLQYTCMCMHVLAICALFPLPSSLSQDMGQTLLCSWIQQTSPHGHNTNLFHTQANSHALGCLHITSPEDHELSEGGQAGRCKGE